MSASTRGGALRTFGALTLTGALVTACPSRPSSQPTPPPFSFSPFTTTTAATPSDPLPLSDLQATPAPACNAGYVEVAMQPETVWEQWYAPSLRVCEQAVTRLDGTPGELVDVKNGGPAIWVVDQFAGWTADAARSGPVAVVAFRQATRSTYVGAAVEPGMDAQATLALGSPLEIHLDATLQVEWSVISAAVTNVRQRLGHAISDALGPDGRALVACAQSAVQVTHTLQSQGPTSPVDELHNVMTAANQAMPCRQAIDAAAADSTTVSELTLDDLTIPAEQDLAKLDGEGILGALFDLTKFGIKVER